MGTIFPANLCHSYLKAFGKLLKVVKTLKTTFTCTRFDPVVVFKNQIQAQVAALTAAGAVKVYREVASGSKTDRVQLRQVLAKLAAGDVLLVTPLDRLARSIRDLLNTLAAITGTGAGFTSLGDAWADTTTPTRPSAAHRPRELGHVRARADPRPHQRGTRPREGARRQTRSPPEAHPLSKA